MQNPFIYTYSPTPMTTEETKAKLNAALIAAVAETKDVHADATNPFHKNRYATLAAHLEAIKPIFKKHGLAIIQFPCTQHDMIGVTTKIIHIEGGELSEFVGIPAVSGMKGQDAGAVISYLRRYSLAAVAGVATEDDDGESDRVVKTESKSVATSNYIPNTKASAPVAQSAPGASGCIIPFGKSKGKALEELENNDLNYWANVWEPKPWEKTGKINPKDLNLKAAAVKLWTERNSATEDTSDEVPF